MDDRAGGTGAGALRPGARGLPPELMVSWSRAYRPGWDTSPGEYVAHEVVGWGRSRRLARVEDVSRAFKAYVGVQHFDPGRWNVAGEPRSTFFVSLFVANRTVALRTFSTMPEALAELARFHAVLPSS